MLQSVRRSSLSCFFFNKQESTKGPWYHEFEQRYQQQKASENTIWQTRRCFLELACAASTHALLRLVWRCDMLPCALVRERKLFVLFALSKRPGIYEESVAVVPRVRAAPTAIKKKKVMADMKVFWLSLLAPNNPRPLPPGSELRYVGFALGRKCICYFFPKSPGIYERI